jgi:hypothetical protein
MKMVSTVARNRPPKKPSRRSSPDFIPGTGDSTGRWVRPKIAPDCPNACIVFGWSSKVFTVPSPFSDFQFTPHLFGRTKLHDPSDVSARKKKARPKLPQLRCCTTRFTLSANPLFINRPENIWPRLNFGARHLCRFSVNLQKSIEAG